MNDPKQFVDNVEDTLTELSDIIPTIREFEENNKLTSSHNLLISKIKDDLKDLIRFLKKS